MSEQGTLDFNPRETDPAIEQQLPQNQIDQMLMSSSEDYEATLGKILQIPGVTLEQIKSILMQRIPQHNHHYSYDLDALILACENLRILTTADVVTARSTHQAVMASIKEPSAAQIALAERGAAEQASEAAFDAGGK